jgi:hypothetical protein
MSTPYVVMSPIEHHVARRLLAGEQPAWQDAKRVRTRLLNKSWIIQGPFAWELTTTGKVAYELREALGPDHELTKSQAAALLGQVTPGRHFRRLVSLGLLDEGDALTERGAKIEQILCKYNVSF